MKALRQEQSVLFENGKQAVARYNEQERRGKYRDGDRPCGEVFIFYQEPLEVIGRY